tara:strand:- start:414 stop:935 length:522 start_codon:yes stop_codon:yes gene_type:complete
VLVKADTLLEQIKKHLKENYSLGCNFTNKNTSQKPSNIDSLELNDDLTVRELENSLGAMFNVEVKLFNSEGYSIPPEYTLLQAKDDIFELEDDHNFNTKIQALNTISSSSSYSDIDWVKRVFMQILRDAQSSDHFQQIEEILDVVFQDNEKFMQADFDEIAEAINDKKLALKI